MRPPVNRISTPEAFSRVAVYERSAPAGPVLTVAFINREPRPEWQIAIGALAAAAVLAWFVAGIAYVPPERSLQLILLPCVLGTAAILVWIGRPYRPRILIELDYGRLRFRVRKDGRTTFERPLTTFYNLTVEDHPGLQDERERRAERRQKGAGQIEKQHALVGWFGADGAERAELVYRLEWPKRYSLQEVAGAVNWARKRAPGAPAGAAAPRPGPAIPRRRGSIKPPLD
jgi:hypothetical protein